MEVLIETKGINKKFSVGGISVQPLKNISLTINQGEFVVITGPSGCGKSTLLHVLLGLEIPTSGTVILKKQNLYATLDDDARTEIRKKNIGMVYQQPNWIKSLTVLENIMFALRITRVEDEIAERKSIVALSMVGMLDWKGYNPSELSSGQQQKVALARAIVTDPQIIVADEPTGNLDFDSGRELMNLMQKLQKEGKTIIMVTHDLEYLSYATRSLIMFDGEIVEESNAKQIVEKLAGYKKIFNKAITS